jgi:hypothetical protein
VYHLLVLTCVSLRWQLATRAVQGHQVAAAGGVHHQMGADCGGRDGCPRWAALRSNKVPTQTTTGCCGAAAIVKHLLHRNCCCGLAMRAWSRGSDTLVRRASFIITSWLIRIPPRAFLGHQSRGLCPTVASKAERFEYHAPVPVCGALRTDEVGGTAVRHHHARAERADARAIIA